MTRSKITAEDAYRMGLVSFVSEDPFGKAMEIAEAMLKNVSPTALALTKKALNSASEGNSLSSSLHTENLTQVLLFNSAEGQEFAAAHLRKFQGKSKL